MHYANQTLLARVDDSTFLCGTAQLACEGEVSFPPLALVVVATGQAHHGG